MLDDLTIYKIRSLKNIVSPQEPLSLIVELLNIIFSPEIIDMKFQCKKRYPAAALNIRILEEEQGQQLMIDNLYLPSFFSCRKKKVNCNHFFEESFEIKRKLQLLSPETLKAEQIRRLKILSTKMRPYLTSKNSNVRFNK